MRKVLSIIMLSLIVLSAALSVGADIITGLTHEYGYKTIVFSENTSFTAEQQEYIADMLINGENESATPYNILCLFGHNYTVETVTSVTHCVRTSQPRCLKETLEVGVCTRCGHTYSNLITSGYIGCCP